MRAMTIRYVRDLPEAQRFYEALGMRLDFAGRASRRGRTRWVELVGTGGSVLALHAADDPDVLDELASAAPTSGSSAAGGPPAGGDAPAVELAFDTDAPLETVVGRLRAAGYEPATAIVDEAFGRSFRVRDPEGLELQINEHDHELHG